jgi:membrane protease YdiL (CAAX protease family)
VIILERPRAFPRRGSVSAGRGDVRPAGPAGRRLSPSCQDKLRRVATLRTAPRLAVLGQILLVALPPGPWLGLASRLGLGLAGVLPSAVAPVVHVALTGVLALGLVALALAREPDRRGALGLAPSRASAAIGWGLAGVALAYVTEAVAVAAYVVVARVDLTTELAAKARWSAQLSDIPLVWIVPLSIFVGIYEEVVFRGFLLGRLRELVGSRTLAVIVAAVLFAAGHRYQGSLGMVQTFVVGAVLGALTVARGSVWASIVAHVTIDTFGLFALHVLRPALERVLHQTP